MKIMKDISLEKDCRKFIRNKFKISEIVSTDTDSYAHLYDMSDSDESTEEELLESLLQCTRTLGMCSKGKEHKKKVKKVKKRGRRSMKIIEKVQTLSGHIEKYGYNRSNPIIESGCKPLSPAVVDGSFEANPKFQEAEEKSISLLKNTCIVS
mmetsp:Transcript_28033/g.27871  ORF Transcript_28033/g.27871 Transcript_28033/m.27871 type:complete len:152 (+) Transcript_28033:829-1284(+)